MGPRRRASAAGPAGLTPSRGGVPRPVPGRGLSRPTRIPGTRPAWSFVHEDGHGRPLTAVGSVALAGRRPGRRRLAGRRAAHPVLPRGFRCWPTVPMRNPAKISWLRATLGLTGPAVVLRSGAPDWPPCGPRTCGYATASGPRRWQRNRAGSSSTPCGWPRPSRCGCWTAARAAACAIAWYAWQQARVTADDGTRLDGVLAYTSAGELRAPLLVDGHPVRCADVPQADRDGLDRRTGTGRSRRRHRYRQRRRRTTGRTTCSSTARCGPATPHGTGSSGTSPARRRPLACRAGSTTPAWATRHCSPTRTRRWRARMDAAAAVAVGRACRTGRLRRPRTTGASGPSTRRAAVLDVRVDGRRDGFARLADGWPAPRVAD